MAHVLEAGPVIAGGGGSDSTIVIELTGVSAGESIVVGASWLTGVTITSITCDDESNLTVHDSPINNGSIGICTQIASLAEVTTSGDKTITVNLSGATTHRRAFAASYSGGDTGDWYDASGSGTGASVDASINHTTGSDEALLIVVGSFGGGSSFQASPGASYTEIDFYAAGAEFQNAEYDLDAGAAGVKAANWVNVNQYWGMSTASFNAAPPPIDFEFAGSGGAEAGGSAGTVFSLPLTFSLVGSGGVEAGGSADTEFVFFGANLILIKDLPKVSLSATAAFVGTSAEFDLPVSELEATLISGGAVSATFLLPVTQLESIFAPGIGFTSEFELPKATASATLISDGLLTAVFSLPAARLSAQTLAGQILSGAPTLSAVTLSALLQQDALLTAAFNLPKVQLSADLVAAITATYRTWVLNTRRNALTEYDFEFDGYALFNGLVLGVNSAGVVVLGTQAVDGSTAILARARTAKSNYGETHLKRTPRLYVQGEFDGDMLFRTIVDATGERTYRLLHNHVEGMQQRRVPIGKGPKAVWWQYELENVAGADFTLEGLAAYPTNTRRRVM